MQILVGKNRVPVLIDQEDLPKASGCLNITSHGYVRVITYLGEGLYKQAYLHRLILSPTKNLRVDHINGNRLDNRKSNLRLCSGAGNARNKAQFSGRFKGVHFNKQNKRWVAQITKNYKCHHLGCFLTEEEAALAYNGAAKRLHGQFAHLNKIVGHASQ